MELPESEGFLVLLLELGGKAQRHEDDYVPVLDVHRETGEDFVDDSERHEESLALEAELTANDFEPLDDRDPQVKVVAGKGNERFFVGF